MDAGSPGCACDSLFHLFHKLSTTGRGENSTAEWKFPLSSGFSSATQLAVATTDTGKAGGRFHLADPAFSIAPGAAGCCCCPGKKVFFAVGRPWGTTQPLKFFAVQQRKYAFSYLSCPAGWTPANRISSGRSSFHWLRKQRTSLSTMQREPALPLHKD